MAGTKVGEMMSPDEVVNFNNAMRDDNKNLFDQSLARATRSPGEFANEANQGISERANELGAGRDTSSANTGVDPAIQGAISGAYNQQAGRQINQLRDENSFNANLTKQNKLNQMASAALQQQKLRIQNMNMLTQAQLQNDQARADMISSFAGLGNTAMGMAAGRRKSKKNNMFNTPDESVAGGPMDGGMDDMEGMA